MCCPARSSEELVMSASCEKSDFLPAVRQTKQVKKTKNRKGKKHVKEDKLAAPLSLNHMVRVELPQPTSVQVLEEGEIVEAQEGEFDPEKAIEELSNHLQNQSKEQQGEIGDTRMTTNSQDAMECLFGQEAEEDEINETIQRLAKELPDELLEAPQVCCPIHHVALKHFTSQQGDKYLRCSNLSCVIFCPEDDAEVYLQAIDDLHNSVRVLLSTNLLKRKNLSLRLSHSKANPDRLYLTSRDPGTKFFQWGDEPLRDDNRMCLYDEKPKAIPPYRVKDIREYCNPQVKFKAPIRFAPYKRLPVSSLNNNTMQWMKKKSVQDDGFVMTDSGNIIVFPMEFYGMKYTPELNELNKEMRRTGPPPYDYKLLKARYLAKMKGQDVMLHSLL